MTQTDRAMAILTEHASTPGGLLVCVEPTFLRLLLTDIETAALIDGRVSMLEALTPYLTPEGRSVGAFALAAVKKELDAMQKRVAEERMRNST